ncbi:MAG: SAM-dependent methyltransferase [Nocardioidaceae bacterium]|nr:SAM-dependent methyltransferase [Nocardioidaceae bacterium]
MVPDSSAPFADARPTLARSWRLLKAFRVEQTDPDFFYGALAADSVAQIQHYQSLAGMRVLDVGGGPGYFATAFREAGATYHALDADLGELSGLGDPEAGTVLGSGMALPFRDGSFDVTYSSNVLEHVPQPWTMADEMVRVTRPGGLIYLSYTLWFGPWGGHETAPWHFLGGRRAAKRYECKHGHRPKNVFGESLFAVTAASGIAWARQCEEAVVVVLLPRYLPRWAWWVLKVPGLREVVTWNLALVLRKR